MTSTPPSIRARVAELRSARGWSQATLAARSGVSRTEVSAIETGRVMPSVATALRLAAALGESVETVFGAAPLGVDAATQWAWSPPTRDDSRFWRATVGRTVFTYPVEHGAAGLLPHDGTHEDGSAGRPAHQTIAPGRTLVIAGCDPLAGLLTQEMAAQHGVRAIPLLRSSGDALDLLRRGLVHVAGIHLSNDRARTANDTVVRERLGAGYALVHQVRWDTGIALAPQRRERHVGDLLSAGIRWINREEGSAARDVLDRLLGGRRRPHGYRQVVRDQRAVATAISSGWAEAGVCIRAIAGEKALGFVPVQREAYELCLPEPLLEDPRVVALVATLRSARFRRWLDDIPGCGSGQTGEQRLVA